MLSYLEIITASLLSKNDEVQPQLIIFSSSSQVTKSVQSQVSLANDDFEDVDDDDGTLCGKQFHNNGLRGHRHSRGAPRCSRRRIDNRSAHASGWCKACGCGNRSIRSKHLRGQVREEVFRARRALI